MTASGGVEDITFTNPTKQLIVNGNNAYADTIVFNSFGTARTTSTPPSR